MNPNQFAQRVSWTQVIIFYLIAVLLSAPFRLNLFSVSEVVQLPEGLNIYFSTLKAIGPVAGYLIVRYIFRNTRDTTVSTFFGDDSVRSVAALAIIPVTMTALGVSNTSGLNAHYYGFIYSTMFVVYALFEEYGWRGYLQNALRPLPERIRIILIAVLWFLWHLNFLYQDMTALQHAIHFAFLVLGSWGLLKITDRTHSIAFAGAVHLSFNLLTEVNGEFNKRLLVLGISVAVWILLLRTRKKTA